MQCDLDDWRQEDYCVERGFFSIHHQHKDELLSGKSEPRIRRPFLHLPAQTDESQYSENNVNCLVHLDLSLELTIIDPNKSKRVPSFSFLLSIHPSYPNCSLTRRTRKWRSRMSIMMWVNHSFQSFMNRQMKNKFQMGKTIVFFFQEFVSLLQVIFPGRPNPITGIHYSCITTVAL